MNDRKLPRRIERSLQELHIEWTPTLGDIKQLPNRFRKNVYDYCWDPANRDGRGVSRLALMSVSRVLAHTRSALKVVRERRRDARMITSAIKYLKRLAHDSNFDQTLAGSRIFRGKLQRDGQRRNEKKMYFSPTTFVVANRFEVSRVCCLQDLKRAGRELECCVANGFWARDYWKDCLDGTTELWTVKEVADGHLVGLVCIDTESPRAITEFQGRKDFSEDREFRFSLDEMISLRKTLRIVEDQHDSVVDAGAFDEFMNGTLNFNEFMHTVEIHEQTYELWTGTGLLILRSASGEVGCQDPDPESWELDEESSLPKWTRFKHHGSEGWSLTTRDNYLWSLREPLGAIFFLHPWLIDACKPQKTTGCTTNRTTI